MPLQRGEILGYDFNRMVVEFTMLNQDKTLEMSGGIGVARPARAISPLSGRAMVI